MSIFSRIRQALRREPAVHEVVAEIYMRGADGEICQREAEILTVPGALTFRSPSGNECIINLIEVRR